MKLNFKSPESNISKVQSSLNIMQSHHQPQPEQQQMNNQNPQSSAQSTSNIEHMMLGIDQNDNNHKATSSIPIAQTPLSLPSLHQDSPFDHGQQQNVQTKPEGLLPLPPPFVRVTPSTSSSRRRRGRGTPSLNTVRSVIVYTFLAIIILCAPFALLGTNGNELATDTKFWATQIWNHTKDEMQKRFQNHLGPSIIRNNDDNNNNNNNISQHQGQINTHFVSANEIENNLNSNNNNAIHAQPQLVNDNQMNSQQFKTQQFSSSVPSSSSSSNLNMNQHSNSNPPAIVYNMTAYTGTMPPGITVPSAIMEAIYIKNNVTSPSIPLPSSSTLSTSSPSMNMNNKKSGMTQLAEKLLQGDKKGWKKYTVLTNDGYIELGPTMEGRLTSEVGSKLNGFYSGSLDLCSDAENIRLNFKDSPKVSGHLEITSSCHHHQSATSTSCTRHIQVNNISQILIEPKENNYYIRNIHNVVKKRGPFKGPLKISISDDSLLNITAFCSRGGLGEHSYVRSVHEIKQALSILDKAFSNFHAANHQHVNLNWKHAFQYDVRPASFTKSKFDLFNDQLQQTD